MNHLEIMVEADRRGLLPPDKKLLLDEARRRGLAPGQGPRNAIMNALNKGEEFLSGLTREAVFGLAPGLGEYVAAAGDYVGNRIAPAIGGRPPEDTSFEASLGRVRQQRERFADENPVASTTSYILGGLALGQPIAQASSALARAAPRAAAAVPGYAKAVGTGGAIGGIYGFGEAEGGFENRARGAAKGAALGAGTAGVAVPLVRGVQAATRKTGLSELPELVSGRLDPQRSARRALAKAMVLDETTPNRVAARLRNLGPQATIADAGGENLLGTARAAASVPGPAKNRANMVLNQRIESEGARISKKLNQTLSRGDFYGDQAKFAERLKTRASPLYENAYGKNQAVQSQTIGRILNTPAGRSALRKAAIKMQNDRTLLGVPDAEITAAYREAIELGKAAGPATGVGVARGLKLRTLDYVKRALGDDIGRAIKAGRKDDARILTRLKNDLVKELDKADRTGLYAKARATWGDDAEVLGALDEGRDFLRLDPEQIAQRLGDLSESAQKAFRSGAARAIKDVVDRAPDSAGAARRIFGNELVRKKLRAVMPDSKSYNELARILTAEQKFTQTRNKILAGSMTQPRLAEQQSLEQTLGRLGAMTGPALIPGGGSPLIQAGIGRSVASGIARATPDRSRELAALLFNRNQPANQFLLQELQNEFGRQSARAGQRPTENALVRLLAQQEGKYQENIRLPSLPGF